MAHTIKTLVVRAALLSPLVLSALILSALLLAACSSATPSPTPTAPLDLNPFRTEVAATVLAQVSQTLAAARTATPQAPAAPSPSATLDAAALPTPETLPLTTLPAGATPFELVTPGGTALAPTPTPGTNRAEWVSQTIPDGAVLAPGESFTMTVRLKNVGTATWTDAYLLRFYSGETFGAPQEIPLGQVVLPGQEVDIALPMKAPTRLGDHRSDWVLSDELRANFKEPVFFKIVVANPPTATPRPAPSATPTR